MPIGVPIEGIRAYALGASDRHLAEVGVPREVYFLGEFIAGGYLGLPEESSCAFGQMASWRTHAPEDAQGK